LKRKREKNQSETMRNEAKTFFLVSQKQAKMKRNKMRFASFCFEAKIKKERKRDTLVVVHCEKESRYGTCLYKPVVIFPALWKEKNYGK
jgi:hypothetical protein